MRDLIVTRFSVTLYNIIMINVYICQYKDTTECNMSVKSRLLAQSVFRLSDTTNVIHLL